LIGLALLSGCKNATPASQPKLTVDMNMLDSISRHSDSTYTKPYGRNDFVTAEYFISKKDSSITQVMKDSGKIIRQVIIEKNRKRIYFAQFYANGQLMFKNDLDGYGQFNGESKEYYESGVLKRTGMYKNGFHIGNWKNYDEKAKYVSTDEYNELGQQVKK
jgi:antitoxin component YwqK of YwqJK toxin-antitoxin module